MELDVISKLVRRCKLLKVLELRGAPMEIPNDIFKLYYLKHLNLRDTMVKVIPKSIKYLVNLETLNLKNCYVTELPEEILELHRLRHLLLYSYKGCIGDMFDYIQSFKAPCDIGRNLSLLLKLRCVEANESGGMKMVREIGKLTHLRRLGIAKLRSEDGKDLCSSIAKLTNLRSLMLSSFEEGERLYLDYSIHLSFLRMLELIGCIEKVPEWIRSLNSLTTLKLCWSRLREDPMDSLEGLRFNNQEFKKLKNFDMEKGSMSSLQKWTMKDCELVIELPQGIEHLNLKFCNIENNFFERVVEEKRNGGVNWRLAHVSNCGIYNMSKGDGY